jgi:hypothetical protein
MPPIPGMSRSIRYLFIGVSAFDGLTLGPVAAKTQTKRSFHS